MLPGPLDGASPRQVDAEGLISHEIASVTGLFDSVTEDEAWLLLAHFQFNREKLIEAMLSSDEGEVRRKAGVTAGKGPAPPDGAPGADPETFFCGIELDSVPYEQGFALPCGHWFSHSAWLRLVQASGVRCHSSSTPPNGLPSAQTCVSEGSTDEVVFGAHCPEDGCRERIRRSVFERFLPSLPSSPTRAVELDPVQANAEPCPGVGCSPRQTLRSSPDTHCAVAGTAARAAAAASSPDTNTGHSGAPSTESTVATENVCMDGGAPAVPTLPPLARYIQHCVRAFVACSTGLAYCKGLGCCLVIRRPPGELTLQCPAGHRFCAGRKCAAADAHE